MPVTLEELARALGAEHRGDTSVDDATHDSRQAGPGVLFCAVVGQRADGHDHAADAVAAGSPALLVERWLDLDVAQVRVPDTRAAMGTAAAAVHGHPSQGLQVVGITGTNGKTTTSYLVEAAFAAAGMGTGLIGTVETRIHGERVPGVRTTPEGTDIQRLLARMRDRGVAGVAMEVSSHGLALRRVDGTRFAVGVFTNLSQDHLDFHATMEDYRAAKARLFTPALTEHGIVTIDDEAGRRVATDASVPITTVGRSPAADVRVEDVHAGLDGTVVRLTGPRDALGHTAPVEIRTPLVGAFNGTNAAQAYLAAVAAGVPGDAAVAGIAACTGVPGRLERVDVGQPFTVLVDYAHTPDAITTVLATLRPLLTDGGRLLVVIGAGGDRDRSKRPLMGRAATAADLVLLTSDNPRTEDPEAIVAELAAGTADAPVDSVLVEVDRRRAIAAAFERARPRDVVLIAGRGHETVQEHASGTVPFDDRVVAAALLAETTAPRVGGAA